MVLPNGIPHMHHPMKMTPPEVAAWVGHLKAGDWQALEVEKTFQFNQPFPGVIQDGYQHSHGEGALITYGPEALVYSKFLEVLSTAEPQTQPDGLLTVADIHSFYISVSNQASAMMCHKMADDDKCHLLVAALWNHDQHHPYHATKTDWEQIIKVMPHLKDELLDDDALADHIISKKSFLLWAFFNFEHPDYYHSCFTHTGAMPTIGRVKWLVIVLIHLWNNIIHYLNNPGALHKHYGSDVDASFSQKEIDHLDAAIKAMTHALNVSSRLLEETLETHTTLSIMQQSQNVLARVHAKFSNGIQGVKWWILLPTSVDWCHAPKADAVKLMGHQYGDAMNIASDSPSTSAAGPNQVASTNQEQSLPVCCSTHCHVMSEGEASQSDTQSGDSLVPATPVMVLQNLSIAPLAKGKQTARQQCQGKLGNVKKSINVLRTQKW
ncbi:hypothetical protein FRC11_011566 [Ceratobasidium sp. 423]|nr:hypothetical protein FRC11_011566 [Ceratobasidium sp. 423]